MTTIKLKSSTIDLVCRTCLKMKKEHHNIFEYSQRNQFLSDLLMECIPIKIQKDDDFPRNICNSCIKKLSLVYDFKEMVIKADMQLHNFYQTKNRKLIKQSQKENLLMIKNEEIDSFSEPAIDSALLTNNNEIKLLSASLQNTCDPLSLQNIAIKEEIVDVDLYSNNDAKKQCRDQPKNLDGPSFPYSASVKESCEISELDVIKYPKVSFGGEVSGILNEGSIDHSEIAMEIKIENDLVTERFQTECENKSEKLLSEQITYAKKRKSIRKNSNRNVNEKQVELLDNADYKRIMQMGLSKKEKSILPVFCPDCNRTFTFRYFVGIHAHFHTGNLPFKCDKCDLRFPKRQRLTQHLQKHVKTKNFSCEECGKMFSRLDSVKTHKAVHITGSTYKCDICDKSYKRLYTMQKHRRAHSNTSKYICEICGKIFADLDCLKIHKMRHTIVARQFSCKICKKAFSYKRDLQSHLSQHSKTYVCEQCGKSFYNSSLLQQHIWIHTGEKPFACQICGKKFRQRACIGRHMRTHTGETPYPCKLCSAKFKYSHHLLNHVKVHHKETLQESIS